MTMPGKRKWVGGFLHDVRSRRRAHVQDEQLVTMEIGLLQNQAKNWPRDRPSPEWRCMIPYCFRCTLYVV